MEIDEIRKAKIQISHTIRGDNNIKTKYTHPQVSSALHCNQHYIAMDHKSISDFSSLGGASCRVRRDRVQGSRGALCGG